jgi:hypothetical protein
MHQISVPLNRQQLELVDRTLARGVAPTRAALLQLAVREMMARDAGQAATPGAAPKKEGQS